MPKLCSLTWPYIQLLLVSSYPVFYIAVDASKSCDMCVQPLHSLARLYDLYLNINIPSNQPLFSCYTIAQYINIDSPHLLDRLYDLVVSTRITHINILTLLVIAPHLQILQCTYLNSSHPTQLG